MTEAKTIAYDKDGAPVAIGTLVSVSAGGGTTLGAVTQVTYRQDGSCTFKVSGRRNMVDSKCVSVVLMGAFETIVHRAFADRGVNLKLDEVSEIAYELRSALESDEQTEGGGE